MSINCLNPVLIPNNFNRYNTSKRNYQYYLCGRRVMCRLSFKDFKRFLHDEGIELTEDTLKECYACDVLTGECFPLYLLVPCNKCIVCKNKKIRDWNARMMCETQLYDVPPLFVTLTYNDDFLPLFGLEKRDIQLFIKRLRERLEYLGFPNKLRYVFCGEYGTKTQRAHYHGIIWNMPSLPIHMLLKLVENAWAYRCTYEKYRSISKDFKFYRFEVPKKNKQYFHRLGFAYCKIAHDNSAYYIGKYMFKSEDNTPKGKNPNFFLSSRNNGIGYDYIMSKKKHYQDIPQDLTIDFTNTFSDINGANAGKFKSFKFPFPQYFKEKVFPSGSKVYPSSVYIAYRQLQEQIDIINSCHNVYPIYYMDTYLKNIIDKLNNSEHFRILSPLTLSSENTDIIYAQFVDCRFYSLEHNAINTDNQINLGRFMEFYDNHLGKLQLAYDYLRHFMLEDYDFYSKLQLHDVRQMYGEQSLEHLPDVDIHTKAYELRRDWTTQKAKDMY